MPPNQNPEQAARDRIDIMLEAVWTSGYLFANPPGSGESRAALYRSQ
jgi:hypothetical protein